MMNVLIQLTVYFEDPFWVGIFERTINDEIQVAKVTYGAEPKDYDVYYSYLRSFNKLNFSKPCSIEKHEEKRINPKRMQRNINKNLQVKGIGTKSQEILKKQHEENKIQRAKANKQRKEEREALKFKKKQQKKLEKHKGH